MKKATTLSVLALFACFHPARAQWFDFHAKDKLDGTPQHEFRLGATETTLYPQRREPITDKRAILTVWCSPKQLKLYVSVNNQLVASHGTTVDYRIDEQPPVKSAAWNSSEDSTAAGFWDKKQASSLIDRLSKAKKLFVRINHRVFGTTEASFDLTGMKEALLPYRKECKF